MIVFYNNFKLFTFIIAIQCLALAPVCNGKRAGSGISVIKGNKITQNTYKTKVTINKHYGYRPWGVGSPYNSWYTYGSYGHIYGFIWYTRSSTYRNNPNKEPTICRNEFDNVMDNGTHYEWFICPSQNLTSDYHYCCGESDKEYCCKFSDNGWRVFSVVGSVLVFFLFCGCCCCYCCCNFGRKEQPQPYFQRVFTQKFTTRRGVGGGGGGGGYHFSSNAVPIRDPNAPLEPELLQPQPPYPPQPEPIYPPPPQQPPYPPAPGFIPQPPYPSQSPQPPFMPQPPQPYPPQPSPSFPASGPNYGATYPTPELNNNPILPQSYPTSLPPYQDANPPYPAPYPAGPIPTAGFNVPSAPPPPYKE